MKIKKGSKIHLLLLKLHYSLEKCCIRFVNKACNRMAPSLTPQERVIFKTFSKTEWHFRMFIKKVVKQ